MTTKTRQLPSTIPGLVYTKTTINAFKYFTLDHAASGKHVITFNSGPVGERDKDFINHIDSVIRSFDLDWTQSDDTLAHELGSDEGKQMHNTLCSATIKGDDQRIRINRAA